MRKCIKCQCEFDPAYSFINDVDDAVHFHNTVEDSENWCGECAEDYMERYAENYDERKLFETTNFLVMIANRLIGDMPFGLEKTVYFISEDVREALENIGTKQACFIAEEIKKADLKHKIFNRGC